MSNVIRRLSPGLRNTFLKPFNSLTGRITEQTGSLTYNWATSAPSRSPVLVRVDRIRLIVRLFIRIQVGIVECRIG